MIVLDKGLSFKMCISSPFVILKSTDFSVWEMDIASSDNSGAPANVM